MYTAIDAQIIFKDFITITDYKLNVNFPTMTDNHVKISAGFILRLIFLNFPGYHVSLLKTQFYVFYYIFSKYSLGIVVSCMGDFIIKV